MFFISVPSWQNEISPLLPPLKKFFCEHLEIIHYYTAPGKKSFRQVA